MKNAIVIGTLLLLSGISFAGNVSSPIAEKTEIIPESPSAPSHRLFDRQNVVMFAALGGLITLDGVQTQLMLETHQFGEADPLARPFVNQGWPGQLAASALGYGASLSLVYILHRTHHHKMERCATWFITSAEAANDTRNLLLVQ